MPFSSIRCRTTEVVPSAGRHATRILLFVLLLSNGAVAQIIIRPGDPGTRPVPINPGGGGPGGGGGGIPGGGGVGPGGGGTIIPINPLNPGAGGPATGPQIVTDPGMLAGQSSQAAVVVPTTTTQPGSGTAVAPATYQWTISGGRITSNPTHESVRFTADTAGTLALNVVITAGGSSQSTSAEVIILSPNLAGAITSPASVRTDAAPIAASLPAAQSGDRTFRWSLAGNGAAIVSGQGTNRITLRPGSPGLLEVRCEVTLQRLATVTVRSFLVVTGAGPPVALTIDEGTGGGTFPAGSRVDIFASPPPPGHVFEKWIGDTAILDAPFGPSLAHAIVTVPAHFASLTAVYKSVPEWAPTVVNPFNPGAQASPTGSSLAYHIPLEARGLVILLHDTGGAAANWFERPEQRTLVRELVAAGYGVVALSSADRALGTWSVQPTLAGNADAQLMVAALDRFLEDGSIAAHTPLFLLGVGSGGDSAALLAQQLATATPARPIKGAVLYCAAGSAMNAVTSRVPQFFALAAYDGSATGTNAEARENSQLLTGRGIASAVVTNNVSPLPAGRFRALGMGSSSFTAADAHAIWTALKSAEFLDTNDYPKSVPTADAVRVVLPAALQSRAADVAAQFAVALGAPEFFSDANSRVIDFLDRRVAEAPPPLPGRLVNLSTRSKIAYLGDTFTLGFILSGTDRATLLIRGIGPGLTRFGASDALPAPRLEISRGTTLVAANEVWDDVENGTAVAAAAASVGAFALPRGSRDTAVLITLEPGAYTAKITSVNGAVGEVVAEVYDVSRNATRLTNLSALARVGIEGEPVIPGMVIAGTNPRTLIVRAIGPGLVDLGFSAGGVLEDPRVTIVNRAGQTVASNNDWNQAGTTETAMLTRAFAAAGAFPLKTTNADAALVNAFAPGSYILLTTPAPPAANLFNPRTSVDTGAVLVEVYELP